MSAKVSGLMVVHNEAHNIESALQTLLPWCDDVVVVDQESTDGTVEIAGKMGARVFSAPKQDIPEPSIQFGMEQCTHDYVFRLDGDERIPVALAEISRSVAEQGAYEAVFVPRATYLLGLWIREHNWWPGYQLRLFKKSAIQVSPNVHGGPMPKPGAATGFIPAEERFALQHFSYVDISDWLKRMDRYTDLEVRKMGAMGRQFSLEQSLDLCYREFREIMTTAVVADKNVHAAIGFMRMAYRMVQCAKIWQSEVGLSHAEILEKYAQINAGLQQAWQSKAPFKEEAP